MIMIIVMIVMITMTMRSILTKGICKPRLSDDDDDDGN